MTKCVGSRVRVTLVRCVSQLQTWGKETPHSRELGHKNSKPLTQVYGKENSPKDRTFVFLRGRSRHPETVQNPPEVDDRAPWEGILRHP